jgi:hypothetical protein
MSHQQPETTLQDVFDRIDTACAGMGAHNPNRVLLLQCKAALVALAQQLPNDGLTRTKGGIILP